MKGNITPGTRERLPMSDIRRTYFIRLAGRCAVFVLCALLWLLRPGEFDILAGMNFFRGFSPLHLLWALWMADMFWQLVPTRHKMSLGARKMFGRNFRAAKEPVSAAALRRHIAESTKYAYRVMLLWAALGACIGALYFAGLIARKELFLITAAFYVCDLICVLFWCPFRLMMKIRCCTTCRIFNWDHLMMFTPMLFVPGFCSWSLFGLSLLVWAVWEICVLRHPERFLAVTNEALRCGSCTDKLCTQYCEKRRGTQVRPR